MNANEAYNTHHEGQRVRWELSGLTGKGTIRGLAAKALGYLDFWIVEIDAADRIPGYPYSCMSMGHTALTPLHA